GGDKKQRGPRRALVIPLSFPLWGGQSRALLAATARDVAEHVLDLVAKKDQDDDDYDRDQHEDKGILDHTLSFLAVEQSAQTQIQAGQHGFHLPFWRLEPV